MTEWGSVVRKDPSCKEQMMNIAQVPQRVIAKVGSFHRALVISHGAAGKSLSD